MSEQSGGGPITREQVERAIEAHDRDQGGIADALGGWHWEEQAPDYVREGWRGTTRDGFRAALTRWHDELAAAEPVRRVARWDADADHYVLTPPYTHTYAYVGSTTKRETASAWGYEIEAWGYEIEGGPEPIQTLSRCPDCGGPRTDMDEHDAWCDDCWGKRCQPAEDSPERLRERREALGWTRARTADGLPLLWHDIERLETGRTDDDAADRALYAAALSAEEARRAKLAAERDAHAVPRLGWLEPERPVPRFKVGDWVRNRYTQDAPFRVAESVWSHTYGWLARPVAGYESGVRETSLDSVPEPASPPAPEVVDVRLITKRCAGVEAQHHGDRIGLAWEEHGDARWVPLALLRAMLEAIDAQQGGAS